MTTSNNNSIKIAVVIVNHNSASLTLACINSILNYHANLLLQFIVIDNGTKDETGILSEQISNASYIRLERNLGFAQAVNVGMSIAAQQQFEYALIINPDTYCKQNFITLLFETINKHSQLAAVSPLILKTDETIWYSGGYISRIKGGPCHLNQLPATNHLDYSSQDFVSCCCLLVRVSAYYKAGGLPEVYFLYFEDAELSLQFRAAGYDIGIIPNSSIYHHVSATTDIKSSLYTKLFARNRIWFMHRNYSFLTYFIFSSIHLTIRLPAAVLYFLFIKKSPDNAIAFWQGIISGFMSESNGRTKTN